MNQITILMILITIVILGVIFASAAVAIFLFWLLFHARMGVAVAFMATSLIAVIAVLIYRSSK